MPDDRKRKRGSDLDNTKSKKRKIDHRQATRKRSTVVNQRAIEGTGAMGFEGKKMPTGYGSVSLSAKVNDHPLGDAWSIGRTFTEDTEHAEDAVIDYLEALEWAAEKSKFMIGRERQLAQFFLTRSSDLEVALIREIAKGCKVLVINDLTASPCSSNRGTSKKKNLDGCAERLIQLAERKWEITINADHYYQPRGVGDPKEKSKLAVEDMKAAGIIVNITKT